MDGRETLKWTLLQSVNIRTELIRDPVDESSKQNNTPSGSTKVRKCSKEDCASSIHRQTFHKSGVLVVLSHKIGACYKTCKGDSCGDRGYCMQLITFIMPYLNCQQIHIHKKEHFFFKNQQKNEIASAHLGKMCNSTNWTTTPFGYNLV